MKSLLPISLLSIAFAGFLAMPAASAAVVYPLSQPDSENRQLAQLDRNLTGLSSNVKLPQGGKAKFFSILRNVILFLLSIIALIALAAIIWAGIMYIASLGKEGQAEKAKHIIFYAILGLIIAAGSFAIIRVIETLLLGGK